MNHRGEASSSREIRYNRRGGVEAIPENGAQSRIENVPSHSRREKSRTSHRYNCKRSVLLGLALVIATIWPFHLWKKRLSIPLQPNVGKMDSSWKELLHQTSNSSTINYYREPKFDRRQFFDYGNTSIGREIVETSFRRSGFADLWELCPPISFPMGKDRQDHLDASRIRHDFWKSCLQSAKLAGNTPGTPQHEKWPWWFRTLMRDAVIPKNGLKGPWHMLQFKNVEDENHQPLRLQLCVYEKGGTKHWKKLQCEHNHDYFQDGNTSRPDYNQCFAKQPPYDGDMTTSKPTENRRSDKVVFLRDPLERFLSGFLDKCVRRRDSVDHCEPTAIFSGSDRNPSNSTEATPQSPIDTMLWDKRRSFQAYVDTFPLTWNMHFFPQSLYCGGLYRTIHHYDFIGSMGESFYRDLLELQNLYPLLEQGMESIFHLSSKRPTDGGIATGVETGASGKVLDYYTPHTVRRVLEYYAMDYITLNMPIPQWAEAILSE